MLVKRFNDWPLRLDCFVASHKVDQFRYGVFDCCLFVCGAIEAMTGVDPAAEFRGKYTSREQAVSLIREAAGSPSVRAIAEYVTARHGMSPVQIGHAQRGDLVLIKRSRDYSLGIVALDGRRIMVSTRKGIQFIPIASATTAFRV